MALTDLLDQGLPQTSVCEKNIVSVKFFFAKSNIFILKYFVSIKIEHTI